jgi:predicted XRE-type DNA-binding protein
MKPIRFLGTARRDLAAFPELARRQAGYELFMVQVGREPADFKPLPTVGSGAYEIRIRDARCVPRRVRGQVRGNGLCLARFSEEDPKDVPGRYQVGSAALQVNRRAVMKKKQSRQVKRANNVFLDLGFPPHEAAVMLLRCELAEALRKWMDREAISQVEAAKRLGVVQPRISEIVRNKVDKLSLDYLVGLCAKAGVSVAVKLAA